MASARSTQSSTGRATARLLLSLWLAAALLPVFDLSGQQRSPGSSQFSEGFRAFKQEDWEEVADRMLAALADRPEDGELTRVYGRWFEPFLPRYYLGAALYELGCYQLSLEQLDASLLSQETIKGAKKQLEELESLKLKSDRFLRQGITESRDADCERWRERIAQIALEEPHEPKNPSL